MIDTVTTIALAILTFSILLCLFRMVAGPSIPDRVIAVDAIYTQAMTAMVILAIKYRSGTYYDVIFIIAILAFLGTVGYAKYLMRGKVID